MSPRMRTSVQANASPRSPRNIAEGPSSAPAVSTYFRVARLLLAPPTTRLAEAPTGRFGALFWLVALLTPLLASCMLQAAPPAAPTVVDGVLDVRAWNFDRDGPVRLDGDWELVSDGALGPEPHEDHARRTDFVTVPWKEAHHTGTSGRDVDGSPSVTLRVRVETAIPSPGYVLEFIESPAEAFYVACTTARGATTTLAGGLASSEPGDRFREGLGPWGDVGVPESATCTWTLPRGARDRVVALASPVLRTASSARYAGVALAVVPLVNAAMFATLVAFCLTILLTQRGDAVARWSLAFSLFWLLRILASNRGALLELTGDSPFGAVPWYRISYATLWLSAAGFLRYGEAVSGRRALGRNVILAVLALGTATAALGSYAANRHFLAVGEAAALATPVTTLHALFLAPKTRAVLLARLGLGVALLGTAGNIAFFTATSHHSTLFELLISSEPLFQMAVLAVRAQEARQRSADLAAATLRFVPQEFLHALGHADVSTAKLGDATSRSLTVLFTDIRNFTDLSERMSPAETFAFLNGCLSRVGPHVREHGGFIDKYIGDAIMALFPNRPGDALRAALAMQREVRASNARHPEGPQVSLGIGLHLGNVMMGTIGEAERFEATVISDVVNLTARLESLTKQLGCAVVLSGDVYAGLDDALRVHTRRLGTFVVKGKARSVTIYECFASDPDALREAKIRSRARLEAMLDAFAENRLDAARTLAMALCDACPEDGPASWWALRLAGQAAAPPPDVPSSPGVVYLEWK